MSRRFSSTNRWGASVEAGVVSGCGLMTERGDCGARSVVKTTKKKEAKRQQWRRFAGGEEIGWEDRGRCWG